MRSRFQKIVLVLGVLLSGCLLWETMTGSRVSQSCPLATRYHAHNRTQRNYQQTAAEAPHVVPAGTRDSVAKAGGDNAKKVRQPPIVGRSRFGPVSPE